MGSRAFASKTEPRGKRSGRGRIRLIGAGDEWQALADAAFFYLNTSVHASSPASTSIFGLATWHDLITTMVT